MTNTNRELLHDAILRITRPYTGTREYVFRHETDFRINTRAFY